MIDFCTRLYNKLSEVGPGYLLYIAVRRLTKPRLFEIRGIYVIALRLDELPTVAKEQLDVREAKATEGDRFAAFGERAERVAQRFACGQRAWVIERDGEWLACDWLGQRTKLCCDWLTIKGSAGDVWGEYIIVRRGYRGAGLAPRLRSQVARSCASLGYRRMLGIIDWPNRNSIRALRKVGYAPVGSLLFVSVLGRSAVRIGTRWRLGAWRSHSPLELSIEDVEIATGSVDWFATR